MSEQEQDKEDVLVVVSKLKNYIRETSGMNTSGNVTGILTQMIKKVCDKAIENAKNDGRKTVMDRDIGNTEETTV